MKLLKIKTLALMKAFGLARSKKIKEFKKEEKTASMKILGKWNVVSSILVTTVPGAKNETRKGKDHEYLDFRKDGKAYLKLLDLNEKELATYKLKSDAELSLSEGNTEEIYAIKKLTDRELVIHGLICRKLGNTEITMTLNRD